jgi:hypothetical protein
MKAFMVHGFQSISNGGEKKIFKAQILGILILLTFFFQPVYSTKPIEVKDIEHIRFFLIFETFKPLELKKAVLYYSASKGFAKKDSVVINVPNNLQFSDSFVVRPRWKYQVYLILKLSFNDKERFSNIFRYSREKPLWEVFVNDTTLRVSPKLAGDKGSGQSSLKGIALIIQAAFEMILALLISRIFGWPPLIILMVLVANIAAFPLYMLNIQNLILREILIFLVKGIVMWLVGMRKLDFYKIILTTVIVYLLGFGFKQILFFVIQML